MILDDGLLRPIGLFAIGTGALSRGR